MARNPNSFFREVSSALNARPSRHCVVNHFHYSMSMRSIIVVYCVSFLPPTLDPWVDWNGVEWSVQPNGGTSRMPYVGSLNKSTRTPCQTGCASCPYDYLFLFDLFLLILEEIIIIIIIIMY